MTLRDSFVTSIVSLSYHETGFLYLTLIMKQASYICPYYLGLMLFYSLTIIAAEMLQKWKCLLNVLHLCYIKFLLYMSYLCYTFYYIIMICLYVSYMFFKFVTYFYFHII